MTCCIAKRGDEERRVVSQGGTQTGAAREGVSRQLKYNVSDQYISQEDEQVACILCAPVGSTC